MVSTRRNYEALPTSSSDLPRAQIRVHEAEGEDEGCVVAVTFEIDFVKYTMFRRIIESTTRSEYTSFWSQFAAKIKSLKSSPEGEVSVLEDVATELEKATAMLEGHGKQASKRSALRRINTSSRKLLGLANLAPSNDKSTQISKENTETYGQKCLSFVLEGVAHLRKRLSGSDTRVVVACSAVFFAAIVGMLALKQMWTIHRLLRDLDARLEKMTDLNKILLSQLEGRKSGDMSCLDQN